jgi:[ribosomal protein S5]-alanine N-acetyltransferase
VHQHPTAPRGAGECRCRLIRLTRSELRRWQETDVTSLVRHANDRRISGNLRDRFPSPYTDDDAREWIGIASGEEPLHHFAIVVDGEAVGGIGLEPQPDVFRRSVEIGYWLGLEYWGRGIMTEAVCAVTEHAIKTLDVCRVFAGVFDPNPASARVLEKAGFVQEGRLRRCVFKDGRMRDQLLYAYVVEDDVDAIRSRGR